MQMSYKKLFDITYNNKKFAIFIDENHRRTFLEINELGEYIYPTLEDFIALNEIYNNKNPNVNCSIGRFTYKEKVRVASGLLAVLVSINSLGGCTNKYSVSLRDGSLAVSATSDQTKENEKTVYIKDIKELEEYLGHLSVTKEDVSLAIDNNSNLPLEYKEVYHEILEEFTSRYPNFNLRIFYENVKNIEVEEFETMEELQAKYEEMYKKKEYVSGWHDQELNKIFVTKNRPKEVLYHELAHTTFSITRKINGVKIIRSNYIDGKYRGYALKEAMNNRATSYFTTTTTYEQEGKILDYLLNYVSLDYETYNETGIWYLRELLMEKFPDVDIDYIIDATDSIYDSEVSLNEKKALYNLPEFVEELFLLCTKDIDLKNPYASFCHFYKLIKGAFDSLDYLDRYNEILQKLGFKNIVTRDFLEQKSQELRQATHLLVLKESGITAILNYIKIDKKFLYTEVSPDGTLTSKEIEVSHVRGVMEIENTIDYAYYLLKDSGPNFWQDLNEEEKLVSPYQYKEMPFYYNGNLVLSEKNAYDIDIELGLTPDGRIGIILSKEGKIIFESDHNWIRKTPLVSLDYYLNNRWMDDIELTDLISDDYLRRYFLHDEGLNNLVITEDGITIMPSYKIAIKDADNTMYNIRYCYISNYISTEDKFYLCLGDGSYYLISEEKMEKVVLSYTYLEDILFYYNMLNEDKLEYEFTLAEIGNLFKNYMNDTKKEENKTR